MNKIEINPPEIPFLERYKLLIGSVVPRPIGFISTINSSGANNLAPFSFFTAVCSNPMTVLFCPAIRVIDTKEKDTLANVKETKEFVVNIVSEEIGKQMSICSEDFPAEVDEFEVSGLTKEKAKLIKPALVAEAKINFECKLTQIIEIGKVPGAGSIVIGEVVYVHIANEVYDQGRILIDQLKPIGRLGGNTYCPVKDIFKIS